MNKEHNGIKLVYSDDLPNVDNLNKNRFIASVNDVEENSLFDCIDTIKGVNPYTKIEKAQYNKNEKKLYFYASEPIQVKRWYQYNDLTYINPDSDTGLIKKIINIIESQDTIDTTCISAYDLMNILREYNDKFMYHLHKVTNELNDEIKAKIASSAEIDELNMNFYNRILNVKYKKYATSDFKNISFVKKGGKLTVEKSDSPYALELLESCEKSLSKYYDFMFATRDYRNEVRWSGEMSNGDLYLDIYNEYINIHDKPYLPHLRLYNRVDNEKYEVITNFKVVDNILKGCEEQLFKKSYININLCPTWVREDAIDFRIDQIKKKVNSLREIKSKTRS